MSLKKEISTENALLILDHIKDGIVFTDCAIKNSSDETDRIKKFTNLNKIIESKTSLTLFDNTTKSINCNKISFDERNESFVATEHLIKCGCKKIMFFRDSLVSQKSIDQFIGYRKALDQYNIPFEKKPG